MSTIATKVKESFVTKNDVPKAYTPLEMYQFINDLPEDCYCVHMKKKSGEVFKVKAESFNDFAGFTVRHLLEISKRNEYLAFYIFFEYCSNLKALKLPNQAFNYVITLFLDKITYAEIRMMSTPWFIEHLIDEFKPIVTKQYKSAPALSEFLNETPAFIREYIEYIAYELCKMPDILLKEIDFKEALDKAHFDTNYPMEGYWDKREKEIVKAVTESNLSLSEQRALVLAKRKEKGEQWRYPIPSETAWAGKEEFLQCIEAFEKLAFIEEDHKQLMMLLLFPEVSQTQKTALNEMLNNLLPIKIHKNRERGHAAQRLPLKIKDKEGAGNSEFTIKFREAKSHAQNYIGWTEAYKWYVRDLNIVPSKAFLMHFQEILKDCRGIYARSAIFFKRSLDLLLKKNTPSATATAAMLHAYPVATKTVASISSTVDTASAASTPSISLNKQTH